MRHWIRYGTPGDAKFLLSPFKSTYDGVVVNATMVAHATSALANFLSHNLASKPYFFDPQTHAFQHGLRYITSSSAKNQDSNKPNLKRSISKLADAYGEPITKALKQKRAVDPKDFRTTVRQFSLRVLDYQRGVIRDVYRDSGTSRYIKFLDGIHKAGLNTSYDPAFLVAPYFYLDADYWEPWHGVNMQCIEASISSTKENEKLAVQVVMSESLLTDEVFLEKLTSDLKEFSSSISNILIWIDSFSESAQSSRTLMCFSELVQKLAKIAPVTNLYGGYFSILLARFAGLDGLCHGLEYAEDRSVIPVGGGVPVAKYYLPPVHKRLRFVDAVQAITALGGAESVAKFKELICDCKECMFHLSVSVETGFLAYGRTKLIEYRRQGLLQVREFPLPETRKHSVRHYLWAKQAEFSKSSSCQDEIDELGETFGKLKSGMVDEVRHLDRWAKAIKDVVGSL